MGTEQRKIWLLGISGAVVVLLVVGLGAWAFVRGDDKTTPAASGPEIFLSAQDLAGVAVAVTLQASATDLPAGGEVHAVLRAIRVPYYDEDTGETSDDTGPVDDSTCMRAAESDSETPLLADALRTVGADGVARLQAAAQVDPEVYRAVCAYVTVPNGSQTRTVRKFVRVPGADA